MRVFGIPEEKKTVWKVPYKDGGFIRLTRRWELLEVELREFGRKSGVLVNFDPIGSVIECENGNGRIMFRGEEVRNTNSDMTAYPVCKTITSTQECFGINARVMGAKLYLFKVYFPTGHDYFKFPAMG